MDRAPIQPNRDRGARHRGWIVVRTADLRVGDQISVGQRAGTITGLQPGPRGTLLITLEDHDMPLLGWPTSEWTVHRRPGYAAGDDPVRRDELAAVLVPVIIVAFGILIVAAVILASL